MSDHYIETPGIRTLTYFDKGTQQSTVVMQQVMASFDYLGDVVSVHGDFKRPNYQRFAHVVQYEGSGLYTIDAPGFYNTQAGVGLFSDPWASWDSFPNVTVYNQAISRLYDQIRGDVDLSIDLAEASKSQKMMRRTVQAMANLATTFRKMKRSSPQDWGNLWLEYTYGWRPLVKSIYGAAEKLIVGPRSPQMLAIKATASGQDCKREWTTGVKFYGAVRTNYTLRQNRVKIVCRYNFAENRIDELAGFTSLNPYSIAWELTPYSFVVDWFINFGGYLRSAESACLYGTDFLEGYSVEGALGDMHSFAGGTDIDSANSITQTIAGSGSQRTTWKVRSPLGASPLPRVPKFDPHLGASRLVSGASLLGQMSDLLANKNKLPEAKVNRDFKLEQQRFANWLRNIRVELNATRPIRR